MTRLTSVTRTLVAITLLLVCRTVTAAQCSAVFPDAVSTHKNGGKITFSFNSSIVGSPDNILDTSQVQFNNAGSSVLTCSTAECSASGNLSPSFDPVSFKTTSIKTDVNVGYQQQVTIGDGTNNSNEFDQVNSSSASSATITFSSDYDEYIIDKLVLGYANTLNLQGGSTYWFNEFVLSSSTRVVVQGTGTAIVLVNKKVSFPFESLINSPSRGVSGDASKLVLYADNQVDLAQSTFSGSLYSNNTVSTGYDSRIFGAVSADKVDVEQQTIITYQASEIADTDFGSLCSANTPTELIAHFEFEQGTGQTALDSSSYNRDAVLGGSNAVNDLDPTWQCEASGFYMDFDQSKKQRLTTSSFVPPEQGVIAFWMKIPQLPTSLSRIFGFSDGYEIRFDTSGSMYVDINKTGTNSSIRTSGVFTITDTWTHFAFTTDANSGDWAVYINGLLDNSGNESLSVQPSSVLTIGGSTWKPNNGYFNGSLDDFRIYTGLLSASEIAALATTPPQECVQVHHYDISHPSQAFTCEPASITIKACADASCTLSDDEVTLNFQANNTTVSSHAFEEDTSFLYANTTAETVVLSIDSPTIIPLSALTCNGVSGGDACDLKFVDSGFQFFGANVVTVGGVEVPDPVPDQLAESDFQNINLRAVEKDTNTGSCKAALQGAQNITFGFDCDSPDICLTNFAGMDVTGGGSGEFLQTVPLTFNLDGVASLLPLNLNYADAGRLTLSAESTSNPKILKGTGSVDVYPSYLKLAVQNTDLLYTGTSDSDLYTAGLDFIYSIGAYGAQDNLLPNYQPENLAFKVHNKSIVTDTINGAFAYDTGKTVVSIGSDFATADSVTFSNGEHDFENAYYTETGLFTLDVRDTSYLGNVISSQSDLELGTFIPAYYSVAFDTGISVENTYDNAVLDDFTYIGQAMPFVTEPTFTIVPKNAQNQTIKNYIYEGWTYAPELADLQDDNQLTFTDSSSYTDSFEEKHINAPIITDELSLFGKRVTFDDTQATYRKVDDAGKMYDPVSPFTANFNITFLALFFTEKPSVTHTICYKDAYTDLDCKGYTYENNLTGADLRFGRFALQNNYGPETESLQVPFTAEYFVAGNWLVNALDNDTQISFDESANQLILKQVGTVDLTADIGNISSVGTLVMGIASLSSDLLLNAPGKPGELLLQLDPTLSPHTWPSYLNYDWNGDGVICNSENCPDTDDDGSEYQQTDFPSATISFGLFRGNDRIIQWREVFN